MHNCNLVISFNYKHSVTRIAIILSIFFWSENLFCQFKLDYELFYSKQIFDDFIEEPSFTNTINGESWQEATSLKLGEGFGFNFNVDYTYRKFYTIGLGIGYFYNQETVNQKIDQEFSRISRFKNNRYPIQLYIGLQNPNKKLSYGTEIGINIRINDKVRNNIIIEDKSIEFRLEEEIVFLDYMNIGWSSRIWIRHKLVNNIPIYFSYFVGCSIHLFSQDRGQVVSYFLNGSDLLHQLNARSKDFIYKNQYIGLMNSDNEDPNIPQQRLKEYHSIAELMLGFKISYNF